MKYPREDLITATMNARERHARVIFKSDVIAEKIQDAAGKGAGHLHITQKLPYTLKSTRAAQELVQWAKENDYSIHWTPKVKKLTSGVFQHFRELVIWWVDYDASLSAQEVSEMKELINLHMQYQQLNELPPADGGIIKKYNAGTQPAEKNYEPSL